MYKIRKIQAECLSHVQRRATKLVPKIKRLSYTDRLRGLKVPSLFYRWARGDMIEKYKYVHGLYNVDHMPLELETQTNTRGHSKKTQERELYK